MLMLRRGRPVQSSGSIVGVDLTLELAPHRLRKQVPHEPWRPPVEVYEVAEELVVRIEIAGLGNGAVDVLINRDVLEVRGDRREAPNTHRRRFHESRIRYGPFHVSVPLPFPVDELAASAGYDEGVLTIRLPRLAATQITAAENSQKSALQ